MDNKVKLLRAMQEIGSDMFIDLAELASKLGWNEAQIAGVAKELAKMGLIKLNTGYTHASLTKTGASA
jgi:Mn-dependent DtxR family transcriptional regulator